MRKATIRNAFVQVCTAFTGIVFLYAGLTKSTDLSAFIKVLEQYQFNWPIWLIHLVGTALPPIEGALGLAVLSNLLVDRILLRFITLGAATLFLFCFMGVIWWGLAHNDVFGCGCFGVLGQPLSVFDLARDSVFIIVAVIGLLGRRGEKAVLPPGERQA